MNRYRIIYPRDCDNWGWSVDGYEHLSNRVGGPVSWPKVLMNVSHATTAGCRPIKVVKVPETATRWHD